MPRGPHPTLEQWRILKALSAHDGWVSLVELGTNPLLGEDDVLFVPGMVERGWLEHDFANRAVRMARNQRITLTTTKPGS